MQTVHEIPDRMTALRLHRPGDPAGLVVERVETPRPGEGEVLVRVHAAAITRDELEWPADRLPAVPSYEFSGVVAAAGPGVDWLAPGDEVFGLSPFDRDGAAADYLSLPARLLAPKPKRLDHIHSAAIPLAALSAWQGLFVHGRLESGQRVCIHGASGGVGSYAVQFAHRCGAYVIGTASPQNLSLVRELGADEAVGCPGEDLEKTVGSVDLVFDTAGGERLKQSVHLVRPGGRLVSVAVEPDVEAAAERGIEAIYFVVEPNAAQLREISRLADEGELRSLVAEVYALDRARKAFERSLHARPAGKIVLQIAGQQRQSVDRFTLQG